MSRNIIDTTTDPTAGLMRRLQQLEEQLNSLESTRISQVSYFSGNPAQCAAKLAELASAQPGTMIALLEDKGIEGVLTNLAVLFPAPYGWVKF